MAEKTLEVTDLTYKKVAKKHCYEFKVTMAGFRVSTSLWADSKEELEKKYQKFISNEE